MNQKTKLSYLVVILMALAFSFASLTALAKNDNANKSDKSDKSSRSEGKSKSKAVNLKNFEKPNKTIGETNAQIHKEKTREVVENLEQVATQEESAGNNEVSNQIEQVVQEQEQTQAEVVGAIEELETRNKFKTFLIGTDYKNLGQLRSSLVHNRNEIRKLTKALNLMAGTGNIISGTGNIVSGTGTDNQVAIQEQLQTLMQERQRIQEIIAQNEEGFSLLGWVSRFMAGYVPTPVNQQEESQLVNEVNTAIENTTPDVTTSTVPTSTAPVTTP